MSVSKFREPKNDRKLSMVTCYDYSFARILNKSNIDGILVGDSLGMVMYGHRDTLSVDISLMSRHVHAVRNGFDGFLVADVPFLTCQGSVDQFLNEIRQLMGAGADAVKIEGLPDDGEKIRLLVEAGVPVMGHLGLTPQSYHSLGGFKVQGKTEEEEKKIFSDAKSLQELGCFSVVLECVPEELAHQITRELDIGTVGIGAGSATSGQILVLQDMLGMNSEFTPKFLRRFVQGEEFVLEGIESYIKEVINESFPSKRESF